MKYKKLIVVVFLLATAALNAQEKKIWTLDECISYGIENNIQLKRQTLNTELSKKDLNQSKLNALPNLNGQISHDIGSGRVLDRGTYEWLNTDVNQGDGGVQSNFTLFEGLTGYNAIQKAKLAYLMSLEGLEIEKNDISLEIMSGYLNLLLQQELYLITEEKVKVVEMQVERAERQLEVGNASEGDVLEAKSLVSKEKYGRTLAKNNENEARITLAHLLNLEEVSSFRIQTPELLEPSLVEIPDLHTVYENAIAFLPQVKSAAYNIQYSEKDLAIARGSLSPEVFLSALYYSNYSDKLINPLEADPYNPVLDYPITEQIVNNQYRQFTVGVNIPIFNKWQGRTNISKAKIRLQDAQHNMDGVKQQLMKNVQKYYADVLGALDNYIAANEAFVYSEEAYRHVEEKYKTGMSTSLELEEARNKLYSARSEMISSKYVFTFYLMILDFYQGKHITAI